MDVPKPTDAQWLLRLVAEYCPEVVVLREGLHCYPDTSTASEVKFGVRRRGHLVARLLGLIRPDLFRITFHVRPLDLRVTVLDAGYLHHIERIRRNLGNRFTILRAF